MPEKLKSQAQNEASILSYGLHTALLLVNGLGQEELAAAYDPRSSRGNILRAAGDPFEDPHRPLRLTLASDLRWLQPYLYEGLIELSSFPKVTVDLVPGLPSLGYERAHVADVSLQHQSGTDFVVVTTTREPGMSSSGVLPKGGVRALQQLLSLSEAQARRLMLDAAVHEALGNDYIVSEIGVRARLIRRATWPNQMGFCTVEEAFGLAGAKARMYSSLPLEVLPPDSMITTNVGRLRDQAAMMCAWAVRRALGGALSPDARQEERASASHLLAMRSLLVDALVARDEVYRLTRRHAAGGESRRTDDGASIGVRGNDLLQLLHYHAVSMLDHVFALTDNLAWVAIRRTGTAVKREGEIGFAALVGPRKKGWARAGPLGDVSERLEKSPELAYLLAARRLRNVAIHREGVPYSSVTFDPAPPLPLDRVFALWLDHDDWDSAVTREIGARADLNEPQAIVVVTFLRLVDELWQSVTAFLNEALGLFAWSSSNWAMTDPNFRDTRRFDRLWRQPRQRLLFRFPEKR